MVITGSGRTFCAGQDLLEHSASLQGGAASAFSTLTEQYEPIIATIAGMPKPVIAAINGTCVGAGLAIALACDIRIAVERAAFATAFTAIGLSFDSGLSVTFPRAVGPGSGQ